MGPFPTPGEEKVSIFYGSEILEKMFQLHFGAQNV